ncbi:MAG: ATP-binding protein [Synergistaceae bacterium]|jgi:hypothetical protein|nr:ATP-binding protein [Synergistaceae bacterium]
MIHVVEISGERETAMNKLPKLPIGIQTFEKLRREGYLYVDKTRYLVDLIDNGAVYFLSRPRRFGKSLTVSTFDALFSGKKELFRGLYAEEFMNRSGYQISPVIHLDMSNLTTNMGLDFLRDSLLERVRENACQLGISVESSTPGDAFYSLMKNAAAKYKTSAVLLIDEYDSPILQNIYDPSKAECSREVLRDFYIRIKAADKNLRFVFITGISKFTKMGVFSALNSLKDISAKDKYAAMLGYTEGELLSNFDGYLDKTAMKRNETKNKLVAQIRDYYDGFSFDGHTRVYNPFSTLNFFYDMEFADYWFESATPSSLLDYIKRHDLEAEAFRGCEAHENFTSVAEIERASPESFLFQSGYLSVRKKEGKKLILDYPNMEVLSSLTQLFLYGKFHLEGFAAEAGDLEKALSNGDAEVLVRMYDRLLMTIPYDVYGREERKYEEANASPKYKVYALAESFYHALLFSMLWSSCIHTTAENHSYKGRSDIEAEHNGRCYVIELKIAEGNEAAQKAAEAAICQIHKKGYTDKYIGKDVTIVGIAVDRVSRRVGASKIETRST